MLLEQSHPSQYACKTAQQMEAIVTDSLCQHVVGDMSVKRARLGAEQTPSIEEFVLSSAKRGAFFLLPSSNAVGFCASLQNGECEYRLCWC